MKDRAVRWALFGFVLSIVLMAVKAVGFFMTGSAAVLADALESAVHLVTSSFALFAVWLSSQPGDDNHPYGHGKIEYLSAGLEGVLITGAGVSIVAMAVGRLIAGAEMPRADVGAIVELIAAALAFGGGTALTRAGRDMGSPTIEADGLHIRSDALTSIAGFVGLVIAQWTGASWVDPVVALALALYLIVHGCVIVRRAIGGIMDEARPELLDEIVTILEDSREPGWLAPHAMKVHRLGQSFHVDLHIVFPRFWDLARAHAATHRFSDAMHARFGGNTEAMVHAEPCRPYHCADCDLSGCPIRTAPSTPREAWTVKEVRSRRETMRPKADAPRDSGTHEG